MPGRGGKGKGGGGGGGGEKKKNNNKSSGGGSGGGSSREETVSKAMSYVLRHGADKENLKLDERGYVNCGDLLFWLRLRSLHVTFPELRSIVATNAKQRFALLPLHSAASPPTTTKTDTDTDTDTDADGISSNPSDYLIRATQGHSLAISSENLLSPLLPDDPACPDQVVHGTMADRWERIRASGALKRMGRRHVHFATGVPATAAAAAGAKVKGKAGDDENDDGVAELDIDAAGSLEEEKKGKVKKAVVAAAVDDGGGEQVVSGMRSSADVLVWVDVKRSAREGGIRWWRSENGVVLTEGDGGKGEVALKWVSRVERRGTGEVIWEG